MFGSNDSYKPTEEWSKEMNVEMELVNDFGHELYTDEKIIKKVCQDLLAKVTKKQFQN